MEADVKVNQEVDKEVANVAEFSHQKSLKVHMVTTYWRKAYCILTKFEQNCSDSIAQTNDNSAPERGWRWIQRGQG